MLDAFAALFAALYVAHQVGDHWVQTDHQARHKGLPGWPGRIACAAHVATYGATQAVAVAALVILLGLPLTVPGAIAGAVISLGTHYLADRRTPLRRLALALGMSGMVALGVPRPGRDDNPSLGTGLYALDQSWHVGWIGVAALVMAVL